METADTTHSLTMEIAATTRHQAADILRHRPTTVAIPLRAAIPHRVPILPLAHRAMAEATMEEAPPVAASTAVEVVVDRTAAEAAATVVAAVIANPISHSRWPAQKVRAIFFA